MPVGDNTSALGWLFGSSFDDRQKTVHQQMAREFTLMMLKEEIVLYSQHLLGISNIIADSLSRDHHLDDVTLTQLLLFICPSQLPRNFKILHLQPEITSFISSILDSLPKQQRALPVQTRSTIGLRISGNDSFTGSSLMTTSFWI